MTGADLIKAYRTGRKDFSGAYLYRAGLSGAYLYGANLGGADLGGADLGGADLRGADLSGASLSGAYLYRANLSEASLGGANLRGASLSGAYLSEANLRGASLGGANLGGANLESTCLGPGHPVFVLTDIEIEAAGLEIRGDHVYGWRTMSSVHIGHHVYTPGLHIAPVFSCDRFTACHPGLYLASMRWLATNHSCQGADIVRCYCRRDELIHAGDKWRAKRLWVLPEGHKYAEDHEHGSVA